MTAAGTSAATLGDAPDPTAADRHAFGYQPALDGLRALAVLAVIAYHNGYGWAQGGFLGVDAFFVLSGFLITTLLVLEYRRAERIGLIAFWGRRLRRLFPALLLVLAFCAIYARLRLGPLEIGTFRWDSLSSLFYVTNWRFIASGQSYFDAFVAPSPVRHLWSLAIEEQFYLVWPLVTLVCLRVRRGRTDLLAAVCLVGALASAFAMSILYDATSPSRAYYGTDTRAHTILIGALLAVVVLDRRVVRAGARVALAAAGAAALAVIVWSWTAADGTSAGYYGLGSLAYAVAVAVLIVAVIQPAARLGRVLGVGALCAIGAISYGLYLWHWPIIVWSRDWHFTSSRTVVVIVRLALTFAAATLSYVLVESPIRHGRWFPRGSTSTRWMAPVAVAVGASVLVAGSAGAQPAPTVLTVGTEVPCPAPNPSEIDAARIALARAPIRTPAAPPAVAVVGDSVACSLAPGLAALQAGGPWHFRLGAVIGCGIVSGNVASNAEAPFVPGLTERCAADSARLRRRASRGAPVALVVSTWERVDLLVHGRQIAAGSPEWRRILLHRYDATIADFRRTGTHVVLAAMPSPGPGQLGRFTSHPTVASGRAYGVLDDLLAEVARRHPERVTLMDLRRIVCRSGPPCPRTVGGVALRPVDGVHYSPEGAVWLLRHVLPTVIRTGLGSQATHRVAAVGETP